jgi:hypothetical protein
MSRSGEDGTLAFEAGVDGVTFTSKGFKLLGGLYRAADDSPRPTAVLVHGLHAQRLPVRACGNEVTDWLVGHLGT